MRKIFLLCLSFNILTIFAQDLSTQKKFADSLFNAEQYFDAITEYKRLMFFDTTKTYIFNCNFNIGKCYKAGEKFDDAIKYFSMADIFAKNLDDKYHAKIEIIKSNLLRRTTERALQILNEMENSIEYYEKLDSLNYWRGWTYIFYDNWEKAKYYFEKFQPDHELAKISDKVIKEKYSVTFAKVISYIVPGAGQFYTGNFLSGIMSFGYNILFGLLTAKAFSQDRIFDGIVLGGLLWLRFYRGNIQNAERFAIEKNISISNKALEYLQYEYKGEKP